MTPPAARASTSATRSAKGLLISGPRTAGTMQKAQLLSHPIWMVTHAVWPASWRLGQGRGEQEVVVADGLVEDLGDGAVPPSVVEQLDGAVDVVGAEDHVDVGGLLADELAVLLGQAASHDDLQVGAGVLVPLELAEVAVELVVGVLPDAAGVEDHHVGLVDRAAAVSPSASSKPAMRSESCSFIWHPKVRRKYVRATRERLGPCGVDPTVVHGRSSVAGSTAMRYGPTVGIPRPPGIVAPRPARRPRCAARSAPGL